MNQIPSPQPSPVQPHTPEPFVQNPSESVIFWLVVGIAALFVAYLIVDWIIQRQRQRRVERGWKEQARQAAREVAEAREADRLLTERNTK